MGFVVKDRNGNLKNEVSTNCKKAKDLIEALNSLSNRKQQSQALVGLALHGIEIVTLYFIENTD